ncbi:MAG: hypothetical protein U0T77_03460 [Chitinophagales bacterium]
MTIHILPESKLKNIHSVFQDSFPFLKLEFYGTAHISGEGNSNTSLINLNYSLKELNENAQAFDWEINESMTVTELEKGFFEKTGISAQVFRKSGRSWLQTISTDNWTLAEQNERGREMSEELPEEEPEDYHEQE